MPTVRGATCACGIAVAATLRPERALAACLLPRCDFAAANVRSWWLFAVDIDCKQTENQPMQDAASPPALVETQPATPIIEITFSPSEEHASRYKSELMLINNQLWRRIFFSRIAYFYVDGEGEFLNLVISIRPGNAENAEAIDVVVDYNWGSAKIRTITYKCSRRDVGAECVERIYRTVQRIAPVSVRSAPAAELIFD